MTTLLELVAVAVRVDVPPDATPVGFALSVTVGGGPVLAVTVTTAVAVALPPEPVAVDV